MTPGGYDSTLCGEAFDSLTAKENSLEYSDFELEMDTYLLENISKYKLIGNISYQFRI